MRVAVGLLLTNQQNVTQSYENGIEILWSEPAVLSVCLQFKHAQTRKRCGNSICCGNKLFALKIETFSDSRLKSFLANDEKTGRKMANVKIHKCFRGVQLSFLVPRCGMFTQSYKKDVLFFITNHNSLSLKLFA